MYNIKQVNRRNEQNYIYKYKVTAYGIIISDVIIDCLFTRLFSKLLKISETFQTSKIFLDCCTEFFKIIRKV